MEEKTANNLNELKKEITDFFDHLYLKERINDVIPDQEPDGLNNIIDTEEKLDDVMTEVSVEFDPDLLESEYELFNKPQVDREVQDELARALMGDGFEKTYIIENEIYAFATALGEDETGTPYIRWDLARHINNGNREETTISDYCSDPKHTHKRDDIDNEGYLLRRCSVCGHFSEHKAEPDSWPDLNPTWDLDFKFWAESEDSMETYMQECPNPRCGYIAPDISQPPKVPADFLKSKTYKECGGMTFKSDIAARFYKRYLINFEEQDSENAFFNLRYAAWICDEYDDVENAKTCRKLALPYLEELIKTAKEKHTKEKWLLVKADFLRRTEQFDRLPLEFKNVDIDDQEYRRMLLFELGLAKEGDSECHSQDEVDGYWKKRKF